MDDPARRSAGRPQLGGKFVVPVTACHFLDQIDFLEDIETAMSWYEHVYRVDGPVHRVETDGLQQLKHLFRFEPLTKHLPDPRHAQAQPAIFECARVYIEHLGLWLPTSRRNDQLGYSLECALHSRRIDAALKSIARIRGHPQVPTRRTNGLAIEMRTLDQHIRGVTADLAEATAHDAGDCSCVFSICDDQHVGSQRAVHAIQCLEAFARACIAYHDRAASEFSEIERVQRLAKLLQHVVRRIDDVIDRSLADSAEPGSQPFRGWAHSDTAYNRSHVTRARLAVIDANVDPANTAVCSRAQHAQRRIRSRTPRTGGSTIPCSPPGASSRAMP